MKVLPPATTDEEIFAFLDGWMALVNAEQYEEACAYMDCYPGSDWTPTNILAAVRGVGAKQKTQKLVIRGPSAKNPQERRLFRWQGSRGGYSGTVVYPMRMDGVPYRLNATFLLQRSEEGISVVLNDIFEV